MYRNLIDTFAGLADTILYMLLQIALFNRIGDCNMLVSLTLINSISLTS